MNFQFYVEKLKESDEYKAFIKENPEAFPFSGFFIIELENVAHPDNKQHFDFFSPSANKAVSFQLEEGCKMVSMESTNMVTEKISLEHTFDFENVQGIIQKEMKENGIASQIQKILLSLQHKSDRDFLVGTVFISNFGLIKINIDLNTMKTIEFEKKSFWDMVKFTGKKKE